jgi:uncharacterized protein (DUF1697 family)
MHPEIAPSLGYMEVESCKPKGSLAATSQRLARIVFSIGCEIVPAYIAMLRGVNVSGQKLVRMERLRESCTALGFRSIETYVQSGNIVFLDGRKSPSSLSKSIGQAILRDLGFDVPVLVRTSREMRDLIEGNPFLKERDIDRSKLYVTFLLEAAPKSVLKNLERLSGEADRFYIGRQEIYLYCPGGYGRTKLSNTAFERALSVRATTRNWKTVNTLFEMASKL